MPKSLIIRTTLNFSPEKINTERHATPQVKGSGEEESSGRRSLAPTHPSSDNKGHEVDRAQPEAPHQQSASVYLFAENRPLQHMLKCISLSLLLI